MLRHVIVCMFSDVSKDVSAFKVKVKVSNDTASYRRRLKSSALQKKKLPYLFVECPKRR